MNIKKNRNGNSCGSHIWIIYRLHVTSFIQWDFHMSAGGKISNNILAFKILITDFWSVNIVMKCLNLSILYQILLIFLLVTLHIVIHSIYLRILLMLIIWIRIHFYLHLWILGTLFLFMCICTNKHFFFWYINKRNGMVLRMFE